jgi:hypothetical protein
MVRMGAILGSQRAISRHVVQVPGHALAIDFDAFRHWQQVYRPRFLGHRIEAYAALAAG